MLKADERVVEWFDDPVFFFLGGNGCWRVDQTGN